LTQSVGQPMTRVDGRLKVCGRAIYAAEHSIPNLVYGYMVMSSVPKGRISAFDVRAAERSRGVLTVMTHNNTPKLPSLSKASQAEKPTDRKLQLLQDDRVLYANQPIALVVADTLENAIEGAALVRVKYERQPHQTSLQAGLSQAYTPKKVGGASDDPTSDRGDFQAAFAGAGAKVDHTYTTPFEVHNPMEPHATIAVWEAADKLTLYDATQGVFNDRQRVATLLGLPPDNVHVISPYIGGGFGSKGPAWSHVLLAAMAARQVKRPVKLVVDRPQMFGMLGMRSHTRQTVASAAGSDGKIVAQRHDTLAQTSSFDEFMETASLTARMLYNSPNNVTNHSLVRSDIGTPSFMRAPGEAPGTYALECSMDELAVALKMDPLELRLNNYAEIDPEKNRPWSSKSLRECYRVGADRFGWSKRPPEPRSMRDGHTLIGWGMASSVYPTRTSPSSARAVIHSDGSVLVEAGTQDLGTGTYTVMTQIAADAIGVSPQSVDFRLGDTDYPETPVSGGSQTAASTGSAVHLAGRALREKLIQMAVTDSRSPLHQAGAQEVAIDGGRIVHTRDNARGETLQTLIARSGQKEIEAHADSKPGEERNRYSMYAFGAQFAEVRVDADLGQLQVSRMVGVFGAGRILNPKTARSQLMGGMVFGIGMALHESAVLDHRLGRFVNNNLAEYHLPVNADVPAIEALWVDEVDEHVNPIGVKGIGEIGTTGAAAAIANAVYHATGKRVRDLPITLDKLL
jgi:xanthine dehydrogenase YagR molybdenum-binding subunit